MVSVPSDVLAEHLSRVPVHRALIRTLEHRLFEREELARPVLDIGCGDGHFAAVAFRGGIDAGIDPSPAAVAEARQNGPYRNLAVASGTALPFGDETFRTVVSNCAVEHVAEVDALVREAARVLMPGGRFLFSVMNDRFTGMLFSVRALRRMRLGGLADRYGRWWNRRAVHHHLDSPETWHARLGGCGLKLETETGYMSLEATCVFELAHYLYAVPAFLARKCAGRWSLRRSGAASSLAYRWLKPHAFEPWPAVGSCTFYRARKIAGP
jgi:SAM-dependent methyltransferase